MKKFFLSMLVGCASLFSFTAHADEGMWMLSNISAKTDSILRSLGLELTPEQLYSADGPSLNNAIIQLGGFCSGVVVSNDGLVFTNHHCGFDAIQEHSSTKNDYLKNGFFAKTFADELPNEGLYVLFHLKTVDVTDLILGNIPADAPDRIKDYMIDSISSRLMEMVDYSANGIVSEVSPFYKGSKYFLSVYQRYDDVRLVFAPPQCLGKYGGDTDNWMWPRQTCDFSVFRIYADRNNNPAEYSKDNVPYHPIQYAHVSTQGYEDGSYAMTLGYPGSTERYLSSYGIKSTMDNTNTVRHNSRTVKLNVIREAMNTSDALRIMYASKYASCSNYWKFSLGQNQALDNLKVIDEKKALEKEFADWVNADTIAHARYIGVLDSLKVRYQRIDDAAHDATLWQECAYQGSDIVRFAFSCMMSAVGPNEDDFATKVQKTYKDIDVATDRKQFTELYKYYVKEVRLMPDSLRLTDEQIDMLMDELYSKSVFARPDELSKASDISEVARDMVFDVAMSAIERYREIQTIMSANDPEGYERLLGEGIREMNHEHEYYPDANFTLRLSYGICRPIDFAPGTTGLKEEATNLITTPQSFLNKHYNALQSGTPEEKSDYELIDPVLKWMKAGKFSKQYIDQRTGTLPLCFLTTNDITGGNSGSGMFDGKGRLIGLAFDGNWEAMSGDIKFDNALQRCIGVDIRWVLSVIDDYSHAKRLINELTIE